MALAEDNDMLENLAAAAPDPTLGGPILPWAAKGCAHWLCTHCFDEPDDRGAENRVAVKGISARCRREMLHAVAG